MKLKKAILILIVVAIVAAVGGMGFLALQYFSETAATANSVEGLEIDYLVEGDKSDVENTSLQESKNIFQWLIAKLSSDKTETAEAALRNSTVTENGQRTAVLPSESDDGGSGQETQGAAATNGVKSTIPS